MFHTLSVKELRDLVQMDSPSYDNTIRYEHIIIGDVLELHHKNPGALFQAASQFNCLEMPSSSVGPESGVSDYVCDRTQGPACALACAAGTVWRNYFIDVRRGDGTVQQGQTFDAQINCLEDLESILGNKKLWKLTNGYLFSSNDSMETFTQILKQTDRDTLLERIKIGLHHNVPVNFVSRNWEEPTTDIRVHQAYCSAVPCAYDRSVTATEYDRQLSMTVLRLTATERSVKTKVTSTESNQKTSFSLSHRVSPSSSATLANMLCCLSLL